MIPIKQDLTLEECKELINAWNKNLKNICVEANIFDSYVGMNHDVFLIERHLEDFISLAKDGLIHRQQGDDMMSDKSMREAIENTAKMKQRAEWAEKVAKPAMERLPFRDVDPACKLINDALDSYPEEK